MPTPTIPFEPRATSMHVLRYITAVATTLSFRQAALLCDVAQPTLSTAIAQWEQRMGCQLFERNRRGVRVTAAGQRIVTEAQTVLAAVAQLEQSAHASQPPFHGPVRLGVIPTIGPYLLPHVHQAIDQHYPDLSMPVRESTTQNLFEDLHKGSIDCAIVALLDQMPKTFTQHDIVEEPFYCAVANSHPLSKKKHIQLQDIPPEQLLLLDEGHCLRDQALQACSMRAPQDTGLNYRTTSLETLRQLVAANHGITFMPALAAQGQAQNISYLQIDERASRQLILIWRKNDPRAAAYQELAETIREYVPALAT